MRTVATIFGVVALWASVVQADVIPTTNGCKWVYSDPLGSGASATFDATALADQNYAYIAIDPTNEGTSIKGSTVNSYIYTYNVCAQVPTNAVPKGCSPTSHAAAYMTNTQNQGACTQLTPAVGGQFSKQSMATATLHDPSRPAHGWQVAYPVYSNILCPSVPGNASIQNYLQFRQVMLCEDHPSLTASQTQNGFNQTLVMLDNGPAGCFLDLYTFGWAGCPQECPVVNGQLCAGNGICDYDAAIHKSRCFCNNGYILSNCTMPADPVPGGGIAGAVIGGIVIGLAIVGAYWYTRVRSAPAASFTAPTSSSDGYYEAAE